MKYYGRLSVAALLAIAPLYGFAQEKVEIGRAHV